MQAIEQLDLSEYDIIISSSHAVDIRVLLLESVTYIIRAYSQTLCLKFKSIFKEANLVKGPKALLAKWILHKLRAWDVRSASSVDYFFSNSNYVGRRIANSIVVALRHYILEYI